jgi:uncharacterized protein YprB with RNaseH-like and TPR domain
MRSFDPDEYRPDEGDSDTGRRFDSVLAFKEQLRRDYEGLGFADVLPGKVIRNDYGACFQLSYSLRAALRRTDPAETRERLLGATNLVRGVRSRTQSKLIEQGFSTLTDLENHPRFAGESKRLRELIESGSTDELAEVLGTRLSRSDPSVLSLSGLHPDSDFLFLDIETMGLFAGQPVVVAGLAQLTSENEVRVEQFVVRDFPDELALVYEVGCRIASHAVLVTYNGKAFDVPFLTGRSAYYGLRLEPPRVHFDLLHFCRRAWKAELETCSLSSIEQSILGSTRETDLPGEFVPEFYYEYLRTGNAGYLKPIVDHNRQDVSSLVNIFSTLTEYWSDREA